MKIINKEVSNKWILKEFIRFNQDFISEIIGELIRFVKDFIKDNIKQHLILIIGVSYVIIHILISKILVSSEFIKSIFIFQMEGEVHAGSVFAGLLICESILLTIGIILWGYLSLFYSHLKNQIKSKGSD